MAPSSGGISLPRWSVTLATVIALASGVAALAFLLLPLVLVLLIVLFDSTAHGVMVLLGLLLGWLRGFLPYTPEVFQAIDLDPVGVAFASLARAAPVLGGLLAILIVRRPSGWRIALPLWAVACAMDGRAVAALLAPSMAAGLVCALPAREKQPATPGDPG